MGDVVQYQEDMFFIVHGRKDINISTKKDLESLKYPLEVFLENNKINRVHYFLFWHFSLYSVHLKGEVNCEQENFSIKEYLGFTSWE